jgi:type II restriction/modification system DNA methylase subunit YeeA
MPEHEAALYEAPFEYVREHVRPERLLNRDSWSREHWWIHQRPRPNMREAIAELPRFIGTPRVAKHRIFVWIPAGTLPDSRHFVFARDDDYFFGVLHSKVHEVWSLRLGARHGGGRPTYNATVCFETFPLPWAPGQEPWDDPRVEAIAEAVRELNELRERWLNPEGASEVELKRRTLTNLYNQRPAWLDNAHRTLDCAMWAAYGWDDPNPATVDEDTILARLLALNLERAAAFG